MTALFSSGIRRVRPHYVDAIKVPGVTFRYSDKVASPNQGPQFIFIGSRGHIVGAGSFAAVTCRCVTRVICSWFAPAGDTLVTSGLIGATGE